MKYLLLLLLSTSAISLTGQGIEGFFKKAKDVLNADVPTTKEEAAEALKQTLEIGATDAVDFLSAEDGYYKSIYKILLPEEARTVTKKLKAVPGFQNFEEDIVEKINRAAEGAAGKATPIFVDAIRAITFEDAFNILKGENDAAPLQSSRAFHSSREATTMGSKAAYNGS